MKREKQYNLKETVYAPETIEFVTVAVEYCIFLEKIESTTVEEFADKLTKILPLLYLKAQLVGEIEDDNIGLTETPVTEEDYNYILNKITAIMGQHNDYLEVFVEDMKYSDTPILAHIAENLADIYQDIRNFVAVYEQGIEEGMNEALYVCLDNFKLYWGQTIVNVLRPLHSIKYPADNNPLLNDDLIDSNLDEQW